MEILIFIIVYAAFFYGIFKLAKSKNREPGGWMLASIIISPIYNCNTCYYANFTR